MRPIASLLEGAPRLFAARLPARPPDHLCGLGYSPADPRQSAAEGAVLAHAERALNMVQAYCEIRDSWTGWVRRDAMRAAIHERLLPELRALQAAERRIIATPSPCLLAVLDYARRARRAVPAYTPREGIDYPQPILPDPVREACERLAAEAAEAEAAAKRSAAREYAARMADAIERERAEEARRQKAMAAAGARETPEEARRAQAQVAARIALFQRELKRVAAAAGLDAPPQAAPQGAGETEHRAAPPPANLAPADAGPVAPEARGTKVAPEARGANVAPEARGARVAWRIVRRRRRAERLEASPDTVPPFTHKLLLIDRGARGGELRAFGGFELAGRRETINGVAIRFDHWRRDCYRARLTPAQARALRAPAAGRAAP